MTIQELSELNYVTVEENEAFYKVSVSGAHVLGTIYNKLDEYCSAKVYYCPKHLPLPDMKVYTDKKDAEIRELQDEYFKKLHYTEDNE